MCEKCSICRGSLGLGELNWHDHCMERQEIKSERKRKNEEKRLNTKISCYGCSSNITTGEQEKGKTFINVDGKLFCRSCLVRDKRCTICGRPTEGYGFGSISTMCIFCRSVGYDLLKNLKKY